MEPFDVNATPITDEAYNGDLSVGLRPEIATLKDSEELSRRLERALRKAAQAQPGCPFSLDVWPFERCERTGYCNNAECWLKWALEEEK